MNAYGERMVNRKKQIQEASLGYVTVSFIKGAEWADANPPAPSLDDEADAKFYSSHWRPDKAPAAEYPVVKAIVNVAYHSFLAGRKGTISPEKYDEIASRYLTASEKYLAVVEKYEAKCDEVRELKEKAWKYDQLSK